MSLIYHVTTAGEWIAAVQNGFYEAASLSTEGFIHCSKAEQVAGVLERYFAKKTGLVKLTIEISKLTSRCIPEWSASTGEEFPHIYGPVNLDAVIDVEALP
jgi:uncharacterized protein (DUF952 family)